MIDKRRSFPTNGMRVMTADMAVIPESIESTNRYAPSSSTVLLPTMSSSYDRGMRRMQQQRSLDEVAHMLHSVSGNDVDRTTTTGAAIERHHSFGQGMCNV